MKYLVTHVVDVPDAVYGSWGGMMRALAEVTGHQEQLPLVDTSHDATVTSLDVRHFDEQPEATE